MIEQIGDATLYLGDAYDIVPDLGKIDALITDPPYGMKFQSGMRTIKLDKIKNDDTVDALVWTCNLTVEQASYIFCRWDNLVDVPKPTSLITWVKFGGSMGDLYHEHSRQTESILFYPGLNHRFPKLVGRPGDVLYQQAGKTRNQFHPTEKPVQVMSQVIEWTEGTVVDPFMGSGTTGVSCILAGRKFIGIELDQKYFDIACERIKEAYAQKPIEFEGMKFEQEGLL